MAQSYGSIVSSPQKSRATQKDSRRNVKKGQANGNLTRGYEQLGWEVDKIIGISKREQEKETRKIERTRNRCTKHEKKAHCCIKVAFRTWKIRSEMEKRWVKLGKQNHQLNWWLSYYECFLILLRSIWLSLQTKNDLWRLERRYQKEKHSYEREVQNLRTVDKWCVDRKMGLRRVAFWWVVCPKWYLGN